MTFPDFLEHDRDVGFLSAFRTPAKAKYFLDITERDQIDLLPIAYAYAREQGIPMMIVGGGTNCLFAFDVYEGIIIRNRYTGYTEPYTDGERTYIRVHSGEMSTVFALALYQHYDVSILVPWTGLPGTMGGACIGNAGCFGIEMAQVLVEAEVLDLESGIIHTYTHDDMEYEYRTSILKGNERFFVISILLDISPYDNEQYGTYTPQDIQAIRKVKQPPGFSCGSFFKNPKHTLQEGVVDARLQMFGQLGTLSAGKLIDTAWLKWTRVWGVRVSEQHGNFFINDQKWTWQDVLTLRDIVRETVRERFGIELEEEVRIVTQ